MKNDNLNPFHKTSSDEFEFLCRDLLAKRFDVKRANKLFKQGSKQFGGDIVAYHKGKSTTIVTQSKRYVEEPFGPQDIKDAVDKFIENWESTWKDLDVKEFILYVTQPQKTTKQYQAVKDKTDDLLELGVDFEYVDLENIIKDLKPHRDIVREYLDKGKGNFWEQDICGLEDLASDGLPLQSVSYKILNQNLEQKTELLSEKILNEIEPIRQLARSGKTSEAIAEFSQLKSKNFNHIDGKAKAELLSLEIRISFPHEMETAKVRELLIEIIDENPEFDATFLEALITSYESGIEDALAKLDDCSETSTLNLKLVFLINLNRSDEAFELYQSKKDLIKIDTETKRLYALILLSLDRLDEAEKVIEETFEEHPEWLGVKIARGIILYHNSLSPHILSEFPLAFAEPQPWYLIKTDIASLEKRKIAADLFAEVLSLEQSDNEQKLIMESWYMACLADDPARQEEATEYCQNILEADPKQTYLTVWAITRNLSLDFNLITERFEKVLDDKKISDEVKINQLLVLLALFLRTGKITKAKRHLNKLKSALRDFGENDLIAYWTCQIALVEGKFKTIYEKLFLEIEDINLRRKVQMAALTAEHNANPTRKTERKLTRRLQKLYRKTQDVHSLMLYCQISHSQKFWDNITKVDDVLMKRTKTLDSLRLVCDAHFQNQQYEKCLELLEKYKYIYSVDGIPNDLNLRKTYCLLHTGKVGKAANQAKKIFEKDKTENSFRAFIDTHHHKGDIFSIEKAVKEMESLDKITVSEKLSISKLIASVNTELAQDIWREAKVDLDQAKELVDTAFFYGNQIGLEDETDDLRQQMMEATRRGENSHHFLSVEEVVEMLKRQSEHSQEVDEIYRRGETHTHLLCKERNLMLSEKYRRIPNLNQEKENYKSKLPTMIRHGNRAIDEKSLTAIKPDWNFHLDLSSLLLLHHLDLLDEIEKLAPIYISTKTNLLLDHELDKISQISPARVDALKSIIKFVEDQKIQKLELTKEVNAEEKVEYKTFITEIGEADFRLMSQAIDEDAIVIDYLPVRNKLGEVITEVPGEFRKKVYDWHSILKGLIEGKVLTTNLFKKCQKIIETHEKKDENIDIAAITLDSKLYLMEQTAVELSKAEVLEEVCRNFQVYIDKRDEQLFKDEIREADERKEFAKWIKDLQNRLNEGFDKEIYEGISLEKLNQIPIPQGNEANDYRVESLFEILKLNGDEKDLALIDDRWVSGYQTVDNKTPIFTIYEILIVLKQNEIITEDKFYEILIRLKNENFRYLPTTVDEILYHLENDSPPNTELGTGRFKRSPELKILRRYVADCLLDEEYLQKPIPNPGGKPYYGEIEFVFASQRTIVEAIGNVWRTAESIELAGDKADLLLFDFFAGRFGLQYLLPPRIEEDNGIFYFASEFAELCFQGLIILATNTFGLEERIKRLKAYFDWLEMVFTEKFHTREVFSDQIAKILANFLRPLLQNEDENDEDLIAQREAELQTIHLLFINHLPVHIRDLILDNEDLKKTLEITTEKTIYIGDLKFNIVDLSEAIAKTLKNDTASIALQSDKERILELKNITKDDSKPTVKLSDENFSFDLKESFVGIHLPNAKERLEFIQKESRNFDCSAEDFEDISKKISELENPYVRTDLYNQWTIKSIYICYKNLENFIREKESFSWNEIKEIPLEGLPKHFRFKTNIPAEDFENQFKDSAIKLLSDEGIEETLDRYARFPIKIPIKIIDEFNDLSAEERKKLLGKFRLNWHSPVCKLQYISLALLSLPDDEEILESVKEEISSLLKPDDENLEFEIFHVILRLIGEEFFLNSVTNNWSLPLRLGLIWSHSSAIYNKIIELTDNEPKEFEKLYNYLFSMFSFWRKDVFHLDLHYRLDFLHPNSVEKETFLGFAFGNIFADFPEDLIEKLDFSSQLKNVCSFEHDSLIIPNLNFLKDFSISSNSTNSFLKECFTDFNALIAKEDILVFNNDLIKNYLTSAFDAADDDKELFWQKVIPLSNDLPLNSRFCKDFSEIVKNYDFESDWQKEEKTALINLNFIASQKQSLSEKQVNKLREFLKFVVSDLAKRYPDKPNLNSSEKQEQEEFSYMILAICVTLCIKPNDPLESSKQWNDLVFELGTIWNNLHVWIEPHLFNLWRDLSVEQIQGIGKNLLLAKSVR